MNNVLHLIDELQRRVPAGAPPGTRWKGEAVARTREGDHLAAAAARIDPQGRRREQYWCDDLRVALPVLLRLTCPHTECPHATQVRAQWRAFHGRAEARPPAAPPTRPTPLIEEHAFEVAGRRFVARTARFSCHVRCPHGAHPPITLARQGFDLFEDGVGVAGGLCADGEDDRPRLPDLDTARAWALARWLESMAAIGRVQDAARGTPPDRLT